MTYDPEKYREKREKVLGIKKRGIGFGTLAMIVSVVILLGMGIVTVPQAVSYMATRHLDDAIFKLESGSAWPEGVISGIRSIEGVKNINRNAHSPRLVVTFDRRRVKLSGITARFDLENLDVTLLNRVNHRQHQNTMKQEEEDVETP
jgi:hypothetical protein